MPRQDSIGAVKAPTLDELVLLPESMAVQRHYDAKNYRVFRWLLLLSLIMLLVGIGTALHEHWFVTLVFYIIELLSTLAIFTARNTELVQKWFRQILICWLAFTIVVVKVATLPGRGESEIAPFMVAAVVLIVFRLRLSEQIVLYGANWLSAVLPLDKNGYFATAALPDTGMMIGLSIVTGVFLALAFILTHVEKRRFLVIWRREHGRARERERMKEEIDTARRIQLSMLPQGAPDLGWIEIAAASLPATEVGGDYYDYFRLSPSQLVLVVGDVAGHGLASGLLLSGVRSCLYLLEKDLGSPIEILDRLNYMVRRTTDRRTYMTLLCAVFDRNAEGTHLRLATAGHPPALYLGHGRCEALGNGALPLGTRLDAHYELVSRPLLPRDVLVFYTDGLVEARNAQGQEYGEARLERAVARAGQKGSVREIRDAVLGDLANFKGDSEQADDITLVVARLR
jgi:serine phosphatase RsbU (regulator of sigma subunit)